MSGWGLDDRDRAILREYEDGRTCRTCGKDSEGFDRWSHIADEHPLIDLLIVAESTDSISDLRRVIEALVRQVSKAAS